MYLEDADITRRVNQVSKGRLYGYVQPRLAVQDAAFYVILCGLSGLVWLSVGMYLGCDSRAVILFPRFQCKFLI